MPPKPARQEEHGHDHKLDTFGTGGGESPDSRRMRYDKALRSALEEAINPVNWGPSSGTSGPASRATTNTVNWGCSSGICGSASRATANPVNWSRSSGTSGLASRATANTANRGRSSGTSGPVRRATANPVNRGPSSGTSGPASGATANPVNRGRSSGTSGYAGRATINPVHCSRSSGTSGPASRATANPECQESSASGSTCPGPSSNELPHPCDCDSRRLCLYLLVPHSPQAVVLALSPDLILPARADNRLQSIFDTQNRLAIPIGPRASRGTSHPQERKSENHQPRGDGNWHREFPHGNDYQRRSPRDHSTAVDYSSSYDTGSRELHPPRSDSPNGPRDTCDSHPHFRSDLREGEDMVRENSRRRFLSRGSPPPERGRYSTASGFPHPHHAPSQEPHSRHAYSPNNPRDSFRRSAHPQEANPRNPSGSDPMVRGHDLRGPAAGAATPHAHNMRADRRSVSPSVRGSHRNGRVIHKRTGQSQKAERPPKFGR